MNLAARPARSRRAFSLLEVLIATAVFGIAAAGLLMAVGPTYDALFRISNTSSDAGDLELVKGVVEATTSRDTLLAGGNFALPSGDPVGWTVELQPTTTEAMFLVHLTATRGEREPLDYQYLHFEPRWMEAADEKPRWLPHTFSAGNIGGGATGGGNRGNNAGGQTGRPGNRGGNAGQAGQNGRQPGGRQGAQNGAQNGGRPSGNPSGGNRSGGNPGGGGGGR